MARGSRAEAAAKRVGDIKISGRPAVASQVNAISKVFAKSAVAEAEGKEEKASERIRREAFIQALAGDSALQRKAETKEEEPEKAFKSSGPKIAGGPSNFKVASHINLLHSAERGEKNAGRRFVKQCARAIEAKLKEFDVGGVITQINPGPVVTTYEFKPEAGIKYSRITGLQDDLLLPGAESRIHSD